MLGVFGHCPGFGWEGQTAVSLRCSTHGQQATTGNVTAWPRALTAASHLRMQVYYGHWQGAPVAIKVAMPFTGKAERQLQEFQREVRQRDLLVTLWYKRLGSCCAEPSTGAPQPWKS